MTKILSGADLAGYIKERQAKVVAEMKNRGVAPKLVIIRDNDNPVIAKYVNLKKKYGEDIGVEVQDVLVGAGESSERTDRGDGMETGGATKNEVSADESSEKMGLKMKERLQMAVSKANADPKVSGIIVQLPLSKYESENKASGNERGAEHDKSKISDKVNITDEIVGMIAPEKDVDGLSGRGCFDSATATAINWLLVGHNVELVGKKIALVGKGRLVGAPLEQMWRNSGLDVTVFRRGDDLRKLQEYDIIVSATGQAHVIRPEMLGVGAVVVDAGTASEGGVLMGDVSDEVREMDGLGAITPKVGGVGPLTVGVLFENVINATGA